MRAPSLACRWEDTATGLGRLARSKRGIHSNFQYEHCMYRPTHPEASAHRSSPSSDRSNSCTKKLRLGGLITRTGRGAGKNPQPLEVRALQLRESADGFRLQAESEFRVCGVSNVRPWVTNHIKAGGCTT